MDPLTTALVAQIPAAAALVVWLVKRKATAPNMTERLIGHLEKGADVNIALAKRFDVVEEKLDQVLEKLNGHPKTAARRQSA